MIDLKRVQEYINLGWSKEEALEMVKAEEVEESTKAQNSSNNDNEIELLKKDIESLKKEKEALEEDKKKEEDSFIAEEEKPITVEEAFKNFFN